MRAHGFVGRVVDSTRVSARFPIRLTRLAGSALATTALAAWLILCLAALADAATCGGGRPCKCGATVQGTATLDADLVDCGRVGLRLDAGAKLDCAGHAIEGSLPDSKYGVFVDKVADVEVRGCNISGFQRGIRVRGGKRVLATGNNVHENIIGIESAGTTESGQAIDVRLEDNLVEKNQQDGIHLGSGTVRAKVNRNRLISNGQESLYLLWCVECEITKNLIESAGTSGIYHKNTSGAYYADNTLRRSLFHVRGDSANNVFVRNVLDSSHFVFDGYTSRGYAHDPGWVKVPHDNDVIGGSVGGKKVCFRFQGAYNNRVRGTLIHACKPQTSKAYDKIEPGNNFLDVRQVDDDYDRDKIANVSDACTDADGDGFGDPGFPVSTCKLDNCPEKANPDQADQDGDGFGDACDVCPAVADPAQRDRDHDGAGDTCDSCQDIDGDGNMTGEACPGDNCPQTANADQADADKDGTGDVCDACPFHADAGKSAADAADGDVVCGAAVPSDLDAAGKERFRVGATHFARMESVASGLGPGFNGAGCAECHSRPSPGGSSDRLVTMFGKFGPNGFDPVTALGGPVHQSEGIRTAECSFPTEGLPRSVTPRHRQAMALFGIGLIEAIPDAALVARADPGDKDGDGISGRVNKIDGKVGRFGWKADEATLDSFVAKALQQEIGITSPQRPTEEEGLRKVDCDPVPDPEDDGTHVDALVGFLRLLPPLPVRERDAIAAEGEAHFRAAGCASCHAPELPVAGSALPGRATAALFSDLLLHDMGAQLADGIPAADASGNEFRTAPLWGVRESGPYLHDGRAPTLEAAIGLHGGEAIKARDKYLALKPDERRSVIQFLGTL